MFKLLEVALEQMQVNLEDELQGNNLNAAQSAEKAINEMRNKLKKSHLKSIEKGEYKYESGMIYTDIFSAMESLGDHVMSISEATTGQIS